LVFCAFGEGWIAIFRWCFGPPVYLMAGSKQAAASLILSSG
jgi:hypothetical protein